MTYETFKTLASILDANDNTTTELVTKKDAIFNAEFDEDGQINFDDDNHWYVFTADGKLYSDEEITPAILKKACYIEWSHEIGWTIYVGRSCTKAMLDEAFECNIGHALGCKVAFDELSDAVKAQIAELNVELPEF